MKKTTIIVTVLLIFIISSACTVLQNIGWFFATGKDPYFSPMQEYSDQDCNTLTIRGGWSAPHSVKVDGVEFSCVSQATYFRDDGFFCSDAYSSLDEQYTIEAFQVLLMGEPFNTVTWENDRDWEICDYDGDGAVDSTDSCPADPEVQICACDVGDGDLDGDGTPDCNDTCPEDSAKSEPGRCGCGESDVDTDGDGMPDCLDECQEDPAKEAPEYCGCGIAETDTDGDFIPDCVDLCPEDIGKTEPGICGCGLPDLDEDDDGLVLCEDICPGDAWHDVVGDPCDHDEDGDGSTDNVDGCPFDPEKTAPGICGCGKTEGTCQ